MIILCLDASTTAVGWALFDDGEYLESGVYVPKGKDWVQRVTDFDRWLNDNDLEFDAIGYEIASGDHGNMEVNRKLGAVEFVTRQFCRLQAVQFIDVNVQQVKATGCHKNAPWAATTIKRGKFPEADVVGGDEADAIGVGLAINKLRKEQAWAAQ